MTTRHPFNRIVAWLVDWLMILVWVGIVAVIGSLIFNQTHTALTPGLANLVGFVSLIAPVTLALAWRESSVREATPGKQLRRLRVVHAVSGDRVRFGRALARNALKIAVPWELGHTVVFAIAGSDGSAFDWIIALAAFTFALPIVYVATLFIGDGRTAYDRATGTEVVRD
jgi:uncharacterized RDD family membrane protein YckC